MNGKSKIYFSAFAKLKRKKLDSVKGYYFLGFFDRNQTLDVPILVG